MKNKILIISETHGNEKIGTKVMSEMNLERNPNIRWIIGNKIAAQVSERFINFDMNRIAPGNIESQDYETRRTAEIISLSKKYDFVIDIHGTSSSPKIFTIVTNPKIENILLALSLSIKNIVIWDSKKKEGPITKFVACGVEIECGSQNTDKTAAELKKIMRTIVKKGIDLDKINLTPKNIYQVYGKLMSDNYNNGGKFYDFRKITLNKETFYPLFSNTHKNIACYQMKKIEFIDLLSY